MNEAKVLIISHNVFDMQKNMGRTLSNLFYEWDSSKLAQLYFYNENPRTNVCDTYYRVTDFDVLGTFVGKKYKGSIKTEKNHNVDAKVDKNKNRVYEFARKRKPYQFLVRNFIWRVGKWYTKELQVWLDEFNPEVIFFAAGGYSFAYQVTLKIANDREIPIIPYFCDDYYFIKRNKLSIFDMWVKYDIKRYIKKIIEVSPTYICISENMEKKYSMFFNKKGNVVMNGTDSINQIVKKSKGEFTNKKPLVLSYIGRLGLGRLDSLLDLGKVISEGNLPIRLDVYTTETNNKIISKLTKENGIHYKGVLSGNLVIKTMMNSDAVLHIESFDRKMRERTMYSISTKIPDMLFSGSCVVVYGPSDIASVSYLKENDVGIVIKDSSDIKKKLKELISIEHLEKCSIRARELAQKNHNKSLNSILLKNIINNALYD